ncbi:MAG: cupin domain-containing protein [Alphaproteobacteria bacterium]|nr:cupin domain-containing protein [Alphaproteobacteria bacterium]
MQIHADRSLPAFVKSNELEWIPSPLKGVSRRMLERDGGEVARATSIVNYAPGSSFSEHTHSGGEEFLVLDGTFSDEHGDFPEGTYVRNPVGSSHTPYSTEGCTILVKLWQMPPSDQEWVRTNIFDDGLFDERKAGLSVLPLHENDVETIEIWKLAAGVEVPEKAYKGGIEVFVVSGEVSAGTIAMTTHDWIRVPSGEVFNAKAKSAAMLLVKHGHLDKVIPLPGD